MKLKLWIKNNKNFAEALGEKQKILSYIFGKQSEKVATFKEVFKNSENVFDKGSNEIKNLKKS